jgi:arsenite/tail-anchored protein-transporting ATPase
MPPSLWQPLGGAAVVFVVGKGGVGKTTTAGALAVELADGGISCHLISTDPAHSLHDLFDAGAAVTRVCDGRVRLEPFAAAAHAEAWTRRAAPDILALVQVGTYLDDEEAQRFLDLSLPGIDEVMAALRLVELADGGAPVIVDTAPTGHTLRLLDAGRVLGTWADALEAMAAKGRAVASALSGRTVRLDAERLIDELREAVGRFHDVLLPAAAAVVVTRAGDVVAAETARLMRRLPELGLEPRLLLHSGDDARRSARLSATLPLVHAPWCAAPPRGCDGLRRWRHALRDVPAAAARADARPQGATPSSPPRPRPGGEPAATGAPAGEWLERLPIRLLLFAGKGGVGKSTCAAAAALRISRSRSVLLFGTDPAGSLSEVLGRPVGAEAVQLGQRLRARQISAAHALAALRAEYEDEIDAIFGGLTGERMAATLDRQVAASLWNLAPPGIDEIVALVGLIDAAHGEETIVVDAAPTGHFLRLLQMPTLALDWTHALMRVLIGMHAASVDAIGERLLAFARQLRALRHRLTDGSHAGAFVITLEEPMVQAETRRLLRNLADAGVPVAAVIANRAGRAPSPPAAAVRIAAPREAEGPVGAAALERFVDGWRLLP